MHELVLKAQKLLELHDYGRAESQFQQLLSDNQYNLTDEEKEVCLTELCRMYYQITRYEQCLLTFEKLKEHSPLAVKRLGSYYARAALMAAKDSLPRGRITETQQAYLKAVEICNEYLDVEDPLTHEINDTYVNFSKQFGTGSTQSFSNRQEMEQLRKAHSDYKKMQTTTRSAPADSAPDVSSLRKSGTDSPDEPGHPGFFSFFHAFLVSPGMLLIVSLSFLLTGAVLCSQILSMRAIESALEPQIFCSLNGSRELALLQDGRAAMRVGEKIEHVAFKDIDAQSLNLYHFVFGGHENEIWLQKKDGALCDAAGGALYSLKSPEYELYKKSWAYKDYAQADYQLRKLYPRAFDGKNPQTASLYYTSPATGSAALAAITCASNASDQTWGARALRGDPWPEQKAKLDPYSIFCLNVDNCRFFVRVTDRRGQLLSNGDGQFFVIELVDGRVVTRPVELKLSLDDSEKKVGGGCICITSNGDLKTYIDVFRLIIPSVLWLNLAVAVLWSIWFLSEVRSKRRIFFAFTQVLLPVMFLIGWYLLALM